MDLLALQRELNRLAGTSNMEAAGAANIWAGTQGLELVGALNVKAERSPDGSALELEGVARLLGFTGEEGQPPA